MAPGRQQSHELGFDMYNDTQGPSHISAINPKRLIIWTFPVIIYKCQSHIVMNQCETSTHERHNNPQILCGLIIFSMWDNDVTNSPFKF
jgi:hypothetical protein